MPAPTTLDEFTSFDEGTPEARLQRLIRSDETGRTWDDFINSLATGAPPVRTIRQVENADLLDRFRTVIESRVDATRDTDSPIGKRIYQNTRTTLDAIDQQHEALTFPDSEEWPLDAEFVRFVGDLDAARNPQSPTFHRESWAYVWHECDAADPHFLRDALRVAHGRVGHRPRNDDVLTGFLYYADETVGVEDVFSIPHRGKGAPRHVVVENLEQTMSRLDPVIGAMVVNWVTEVKTNKGRKSNNGWYDHAGRYINIRRDSPISDGYPTNTTAHEVGHALHHLYQFKLTSAAADVDNRGTERDKWEWKVYTPDHTRTSTAQACFRECVRLEWEKLRDGRIEPLREYQTKNATELVADAFACWVATPDHLADTQPRMKQLFDAHFAPRERCPPPREQLFDRWRNADAYSAPAPADA